MKLKTARQRRIVALGIVLLPCMAILRSYIEHKTILDSFIFEATMLVMLVGTFYVFLDGSGPRQKK
jgi:hypothetical protein